MEKGEITMAKSSGLPDVLVGTSDATSTSKSKSKSSLPDVLQGSITERETNSIVSNQIQQDIASKINYRFTPSFAQNNTSKIKTDTARAKASKEVASDITKQVTEKVPIFQKEAFTPSGLKNAIVKDIKNNQQYTAQKIQIPSVNYDSDEAELEAIRKKRTNAFVQKEKAQKNWNEWKNSEGPALQKGMDYIANNEVNNLRQDLNNKENEYNLLDEEYTLKKQQIAEKRIQETYGVSGSEYIALLEQKKNDAQSDSEKDYYEKEIKKTRNKLYGKTNVFEHIGNIVKEGLLQYNKGTAATVDFLLGTPAKWLGFENNIFTQANKDSTRWLEEASTDTYKGSQALGDTNNLSGQFGTALIAAVPDFLLAILSSGASKSKDLTTLAKNLANPTFWNTVKNEIIQTVKSPFFYTSFIRELGNNYEENLKNGANEAQATLAAFFASAVTAKIEIGGFQSLGDEIADTKGFWKKAYQWALSSIEEGLEEPAQTSATNLINKVVYDHDKKIVSLTDEESIFNLKRAAKEFAIGTFVGAALGGGQLTFSGIVNAKSDAQYKEIGKAAIKNTNIQEIIDYAKSSPNDVVRSIARQVDAKTISDADAGRVYQYAVASVNEAFNEVNTVEDLNQVISDYFIASTTPQAIKDIASAKFAEKLVEMNVDPETYEGLTPETASRITPTTESEVESGVVPVEQVEQVLETPVESQQGETVFTEPTNQEIYREPTAQEKQEAMFGKRKDAKQRHIIDVAKKLDSDLKIVYVPKNSKVLNGKNGKYNFDTKTMYLAEDLSTVEAYVEVFKHEFVHKLELRKAYKSFKDYLFNKSVAFEKYAKARLALLDEQEGRGKNVERTREDAVNDLIDMYMKNVKSDQTFTQEFRDNFTREKAEREAVADFVARTLFKDKSQDFLQAIEDKQIGEIVNTETDLDLFAEMANTDRNLLQKIIDAIRDLIASIKGYSNLEQDLRYLEERLARVYESADMKKAATESGEVYKNASDNITKVQKNQKDIIQSIGEKSINNLSEKELDALRPLAKQYWDEMKEKSPLFRAWFGDWRFYDKTKIEIANKLGNARGLVKNNDTSWDINVSAQVFNENNIHKNKISREAKPYMPYIQDIIKKSVLLDSWGMGDLKSENSLLMHSLYAVADIGNGPELLKLYVEEMSDPNNIKTSKRAYKLNNIESQQLSVVGSHKSAIPITSTVGIKTISDLFAVVKQKDKSFSPKPVNKMFLNDDGTPKKFYHGSKKGGGFTSFKPWQYFTENKRYAERYAERDNKESLYEVYLKMENPFDTRDPKCRKIFEQMRLEYGLSELQENGLPDWTDGYDIVDFIEENELDFDGIVLDEGGDIVDGKPISRGLSYVVRNSNQIKSAVENIGTFSENDPDIRYSSDDLSTLQRDLYERHKNGELTNEEYIEEMDRLWENAKEEYGTLPQGEKAKVAANVPAAVSEDKPTERFIRTIIETDTLNGDMLKEMQESTLLGDFSYKVISDESAIKKADKAMENGTANDVWEETINSPRITKNEIAIGEQLLKEAIEKGDTVKVLKLSAELADVFTRAGQNVQAARLFKKMTGPGRLVSLQRTVKTLNKDLRAKYGVEYPPIKIREETAKRLVEAETLNGIEYAYQEAIQEVANQMPSTFLDKWNAWRYFAMLSNPKTHIRNIVGNAIFVPVVRIKDFVGSVLEVRKEQDQKTKSIVVKKAYRDFAKKDAKLDSVKSLLKGNKYNDKSAIREKQKIFKSEVLNFLTEFNSNALEAEDMLFKNIHYVHALAGFLQARNVNLKNVSLEVLEEARIYAVKEAKKATFNDESALANAIQRFGNKNLGTNILVEGVLPFKRTPINIVKRGIEYSPIGLAKTLTKGLYDVKKGKITLSEYIDGLASGLTGTGIMLAGMFLASLGCITGGEDDDKESQFEKWLGKQEYAVEVFGKSYTVDWAAPSNIPFFIGVEIINSARDSEDFSLSQLGNAVWNSLEPITNLSMLSGMQSVIESAKYADSAQTLSAIATDAITSYGMQALPSLSGALGRTIDPTQRSWYIDKNDKVLDSTAQTIKNNIQSKVPGLSYTQIPKIDIWGREVSRGGTTERILENFVSPGYYSKIEVTETSEELKRIYKETGEDVFPSVAKKSFELDKKTKNLTADEYVTYAKAKGEYSYEYVQEFLKSKSYSKLTDDEKAYVIKGLYEYANAKAKTTVSNYDLMKGYKTVTLWERNGKSAVDYYIYRAISK